MSKHAPGPYEVEPRKSDQGQPAYYAIIAPPPKGISGPYTIADTLNCHHCIDPEEARANAEFLASASELADWKSSAIPLLMEWDDIGESVGGDLGSSKVDNVRQELARLRSTNAELLAACEEWATYFDKLNEESLPGDRLVEMRNQFHAKRIRKTREAIAHAKGTP